MNSSNDPIASSAEGFTKGVLSFTKKEIKSLVNKFRDRKLNFINKQENIDLVKELRKSSEWALYCKYIDTDLRVYAQTGLALRRLEKDPTKLEHLRSSIKKSRLGKKGLYIAQLIQNEVLSRYIMLVVPDLFSEKEVKTYINDILRNIEKYVVFITHVTKPEYKLNEIMSKLFSHSPQTLIVFGSRSMIKVAEDVAKRAEDKASEYTLKEVKDKIKYTGFLTKMEDIDF